MAELPRQATHEETSPLLAALGEEFAVVRNPAYVHPPYELYPLAAKSTEPLSALKAVVMDMDGTTTTTEPLCLHSLEYMVRQVTDRPTAGDWSGLDQERDYPHVIGNSTTKHVEYLIDTYGGAIVPRAFGESLIAAVAWTVAMGKDPGRRGEVMDTARHLGLNGLLKDPRLVGLDADDPEALDTLAEVIGDAKAQWTERSYTRDEYVRGAIDIYYARYHQILAQLARGGGADAAEAIFGDRNLRLIEPMPGVGLFFAAMRGWLSREEEVEVFEYHWQRWSASTHAADYLGEAEAKDSCERFVKACSLIAQVPPRLAIVTSSIRYEADIVLQTLFEVLREEIADWPVARETLEKILTALASPEEFYDAIVTASDSSEIRLKPHRDLYSIALHRLGVMPEDFDKVIGLEDSESGLTAIRAAGVGCCIALPFVATRGHALDVAAAIKNGALPELIAQDAFMLSV